MTRIISGRRPRIEEKKFEYATHDAMEPLGEDNLEWIMSNHKIPDEAVIVKTRDNSLDVTKRTFIWYEVQLD